MAGRSPQTLDSTDKNGDAGASNEGQGVFSLSLSKILLTVLIAVVVWKGFALVGRLARERQARAVQDRQRFKARGGGTIELVECTRCGAYFDPRQGCRCSQRRA
jgi:hypothetical protein